MFICEIRNNIGLFFCLFTFFQSRDLENTYSIFREIFLSPNDGTSNFVMRHPSAIANASLRFLLFWSSAESASRYAVRYHCRCFSPFSVGRKFTSAVSRSSVALYVEQCLCVRGRISCVEGWLPSRLRSPDRRACDWAFSVLLLREALKPATHPVLT